MALKEMVEFRAGIGDRFKSVRQALGLKGYEFAELVDVSPGTLCDIEKGNCSPSSYTLCKLHWGTNINLIWLVTGDGNMCRKQ